MLSPLTWTRFEKAAYDNVFDESPKTLRGATIHLLIEHDIGVRKGTLDVLAGDLYAFADLEGGA